MSNQGRLGRFISHSSSTRAVCVCLTKNEKKNQFALAAAAHLSLQGPTRLVISTSQCGANGFGTIGYALVDNPCHQQHEVLDANENQQFLLHWYVAGVLAGCVREIFIIPCFGKKENEKCCKSSVHAE